MIRRLFIKNYRCFGDEPCVIEFSGSGLTALIGPNNVGKSTALKALEILLGDKWPTGQFSLDDFHNNVLDKEMTIACEFSEAIRLDVSGFSVDISGVVVRARHLSTGYGESSIDVEYRLLESKAGLETLEFDYLILANYRNRNGERGDRPIFVSQEIRNRLPIVITVPLIKLHSEQPTNKWGVLGRMLQKVEGLFSADQSKEEEFKEKMTEAVDVLRSPDEFKSIESDIKSFWEEMKPSNLSGTDLVFLDYEPWRYYRQFKLAVKRHEKEVPVDTLGEGVQRLAIIALYRSYLRRHGRNERAILLIEEPESYLHPQARKTLFDVLKMAVRTSDQVEGQIVYTTHSEDFIDCGHFDNILIFSENEDTVEVRRLDDKTLASHTLALGFVDEPLSNQHVFYHLIETVSLGLKESLFASKAIIVEGPSELELFRFMTDVDKDQVAVVVAGGKSNIPALYSLLTAFGVPCLIAIDRDEKREGQNKNIVEMLNQSQAIQPDKTAMSITENQIFSVPDGDILIEGRLLVFGKDLESVLTSKISNYSSIKTRVLSVFNVPDNSKPRYINALGLAYKGYYNGDKDLNNLMGESSKTIKELAERINLFIKQPVIKPLTLNYKSQEKV